MGISMGGRRKTLLRGTKAEPLPCFDWNLPGLCAGVLDIEREPPTSTREKDGTRKAKSETTPGEKHNEENQGKLRGPREAVQKKRSKPRSYFPGKFQSELPLLRWDECQKDK